jgi:hypothetical protein
MGSLTERVRDSDGDESSTDDHQPKKKRGKHTKEDTLQSRKVTKKLDKKLEKDSPAGTNIHTHIKVIYSSL